MRRIVGIAGSMRSASYSRIVLNCFAAKLPADAAFERLDIGIFPHYNEDLESAGLPGAVVAARASVAACDGVIIVTPEFNHGVPGVLKNALDWLSRPAFDSCFKGKPVMFASVAPGPMGGVRAQYQLRETMASMLCNLIPLQELAIAGIGDKVADGRLTDAAALSRIERMLGAFLSAMI